MIVVKSTVRNLLVYLAFTFWIRIAKVLIPNCHVPRVLIGNWKKSRGNQTKREGNTARIGGGLQGNQKDWERIQREIER